MRGTLCLIKLGFGLELAGDNLDGALHFIGNTLHVFAFQSNLLSSVDHAERACPFPPPVVAAGSVGT
jgi:hypothetical protein